MNNIFNPRTAVGNLLLANILIFVAQAMLPRFENMILENFALFPWHSPFFKIWQPITYMFLHGNLTHLLFNMFALWMFGRQIEYDLGTKRFVTFYFVTGVGAALLNMLVSYITMSVTHSPEVIMQTLATPTVGASGAVFGLLLAFGMIHPNERIMLLIPPIPIKAKWFVVIYGVLELFMGIGNFDNVAHFAHLGGMLFGFFLLLYWKKRGQINTYFY